MKKTLLPVLIVLSTMGAFAQSGTDGDTSTFAKTVTNETNDWRIDGNFRRGFSSITEAGTTFSYGQPFFTIQETWGVRVNPYFFIGQGTAVNLAKNKWLDVAATVETRTNFTKTNVSPQFTLGLGINKTNQLSTKENQILNDRQFVLTTGLGLEFRISPIAGITVNGGYKLLTDFDNHVHGGFVRVGYVF
jgi:hypothetical protein